MKKIIKAFTLAEGAANFGKADRTNVRERRLNEQSYVVEFLSNKNETEIKLCELPIIKDTHANIGNKNRKSAFTLAEVLITLMIIGVVAVLTIPNLMLAYKKNFVETALKKNYSVLTQAFKLAAMDEPISSWTNDNEEDKIDGADGLFKKYIAPHMKVTKYIAENKTVPAYTTEGTDRGIPSRVLLNDGTGLHIYHANDPDGQFGYFLFFIDIDGPYKGSNVLGKDIFGLSVFPDKNDSKTPFITMYPIRTKDDTPAKRNEYIQNCYNDPNPSMKGFWCSVPILNNNFKIPDDYPWIK